MASEANNKTAYSSIFDKNDRDLMNKLRDSGQEYFTLTGKLIPAKKPPSIYCYCPQFCQRKLTREKWKELFEQFYSLADQNKQNKFLKTHITVQMHNFVNRCNNNKSNKRRLTCKYTVPDLEPGQHLQQFLDKPSENTIQICQKAFMNAFMITEKRVRKQRENTIQTDSETSDEPLDLSAHSRDDPVQIDKTQLYKLADSLGIPRKIVDEEMASKYETLVRNNIVKQKAKKRRESPTANLRGITEQVVGLEENLAILPRQTLNNGDLTITPLLGPMTVENQDIMTVNLFFQNQLWRPELIGLPAKSESPIFT